MHWIRAVRWFLKLMHKATLADPCTQKLEMLEATGESQLQPPGHARASNTLNARDVEMHHASLPAMFPTPCIGAMHMQPGLLRAFEFPKIRFEIDGDHLATNELQA